MLLGKIPCSSNNSLASCTVLTFCNTTVILAISLRKNPSPKFCGLNVMSK